MVESKAGGAMLTSAILTATLSVAMLTRSTMRAKRIRYVSERAKARQVATWRHATGIEVIA
jgi:hypothetical protein